MALILVGGGSRSGKSSFALTLAKERGTKVAFVATAQAYDDEMRERIRLHQAERAGTFLTIEEPIDLVGMISRSEFDVLLIDCLTLWVSNLMMADEAEIDERGKELVRAATECDTICIFVTNEVGSGVVPDNAMARRFRDHAGRLNQEMAKSAREVYMLQFGIPTRLK